MRKADSQCLESTYQKVFKTSAPSVTALNINKLPREQMEADGSRCFSLGIRFAVLFFITMNAFFIFDVFTK